MDDHLPALIDGVVRDLAEVRTIEGVLKIRDRAEALLAYAKKHRTAVDMQTGAVQVVLLCERRIGVELEKIPRRHGGDRRPPSAMPTAVVDEDPPSLADLGFRRDQVQEYVALARIDPVEIEQAAEEARSAGKALTKSAVKRKAAGSRAARADASGRSPSKRSKKSAATKPPVVSESVARLRDWLLAGDAMSNRFSSGADAWAQVRAAFPGSGIGYMRASLELVSRFVADMTATARAVRAA